MNNDILPWYIVGPLIGLMVPWLLLLGNKKFGVSSSLRHLCAAVFPSRIAFLQYDWKRESWNLLFVLGIAGGAFLASQWWPNPATPNIAPATVSALQEHGVATPSGLIPADLFQWSKLSSWPGFVMLILGGFLVGFGARYAGGCTSGHGITGLSSLQWTSLLAVIFFFAGGLFVTHVVYRWLLP